MKRHTLKEYTEVYKTFRVIYLMFGSQIIKIDKDAHYSWAIYRAFQNYKFEFYNMEEETGKLFLNY